MAISKEYKYDVFISYSHKDKEWVRNKLLPTLEENGVKVIIDFRDFSSSKPSVTEMERAVIESWKTLLVLTPNYLDSEWSEFESLLASTLDPSGKKGRVLPILFEKCEIPLRISFRTYIDFTNPETNSLEWRKLISSFDRFLLSTFTGKEEESSVGSKIRSVREYVESLNAEMEKMIYPGVPNFPTEAKLQLKNVYVEQKFRNSKQDRLISVGYFELSKNSFWLKDTAGTGKSTFLRHVTSLMAKNYLNDSINKIPIKLHASNLTFGEKRLSVEVANYIAQKYDLNPAIASNIEDHIKNGKASILIDAIDEIPFDAQRRLLTVLAESELLDVGNQILLTSRPLGHLNINMMEGHIERFDLTDAYKLISSWQKVFLDNEILTEKTNNLLERLKNEVIKDIYKSGGIQAGIVETPLFLTFLVFYLSSPNISEESEPFSILVSKTRLLNKIVEHVIPYWESQKLGSVDLITPIGNTEALRVLYFVGYLAKSIPNLAISELLFRIDESEKILLMDKAKIREYLTIWTRTNVIRLDVYPIEFWHEEIKDFCAAKHLVSIHKTHPKEEVSIKTQISNPSWNTVRFYYDNIIRLGG